MVRFGNKSSQASECTGSDKQTYDNENTKYFKNTWTNPTTYKLALVKTKQIHGHKKN